MKRSIMLTVSLAVLVTLGLAVWAKSPKDEWLPGEKLKECLELAAAKDTPLAVLYQMQDSTCPIHNGRVSTYETLQDLSGMLKVRVYATNTPAEVAEFRRVSASMLVPVVYLTDGEKHVIGYIAEETPLMEARETAKQAAAVMAWKRTSRAALAAVEKQIEARQLIPARKQVDLVAKQDLAATVAILASIAKANNPAKAGADKKSGAKPAASDAKSAQPPVAEGMFFAAKTNELKAKLDTLLAEKLAEVEALLAQGDTQKASRALAPLLQTRFGETGDAQVKALDEKIKAAMKEAAKARKDTAEKPASETK